MNPPPLPADLKKIIVTTGNSVEGKLISEYLDICRGVLVRSTGLNRGLSGGFKAIAGGNIPEFSEVCDEARHDAYELMLKHAASLKADAIIAFRYDTSSFSDGITEVIAYGTAVKLTE